MRLDPLWAAGPVGVDGERFVDAQGRHLVLRGVNLGGDCKLPYPRGGTQFPSDFADHREVSFVGRPFPLHEADEHLGRLRHWGFNALRWLTTWEAVEHAGPGRHDEAYLDYLEQAVARAGEHGFHVFIDFHQDVWSRLSGGSGAPGWTFEALGLDFTRFDAADAALVMQHRFDYASAAHHQPENYPPMCWPGNYRRPACAIAFTAFFGAARLLPRWQLQGESVQAYLQRHFLGAVDAVARRLARQRHVIGFGTLNEPHTGWLGLGLTQRPPSGPHWPAHAGLQWSPLDGLRLADGQTVEVPTLQRVPAGEPGSGQLRPGDARTMNPRGLRIWRDGVDCPFARHGAWRATGGRGEVVDEDFFRRGFEPMRDAMAPLFAAVAATVRRHRDDWLLFAEASPYALAAGQRMPAAMPPRWVNANHWYDIELLGSKRSRGEPRRLLAQRYAPEFDWLREQAATPAGRVPTLVGEFGVPFDLDGAAAYAQAPRPGPQAAAQERRRWAVHEQALAAAYDEIDARLLSSTQWNYTASNANHPRVGDGWNLEDLSIYSADQRREGLWPDPDAGGRALHGFVRPWVPHTQGRLLRLHFDDTQDLLSLDFEADAAIAAPTVVVLPALRYPQGARIDGAEELQVRHDVAAQRLLLHARRSGLQRLRIAPRPPATHPTAAEPAATRVPGAPA